VVERGDELRPPIEGVQLLTLPFRLVVWALFQASPTLERLAFHARKLPRPLKCRQSVLARLAESASMRPTRTTNCRLSRRAQKPQPEWPPRMARTFQAPGAGSLRRGACYRPECADNRLHSSLSPPSTGTTSQSRVNAFSILYC
jgi:hypothetical protein